MRRHRSSLSAVGLEQKMWKESLNVGCVCKLWRILEESRSDGDKLITTTCMSLLLKVNVGTCRRGARMCIVYNDSSIKSGLKPKIP